MRLESLIKKYKDRIQERMPEIITAHDEKSHFYLMDSKKYPSVTAKLQMLKDEGLMNWKMNRATEYIRSMIALNQNLWSIEWFDQIINDGKLLPNKEFENAGSIGSKIHNWREQWFKQIMAGDNSFFPIPEEEIEVVSGCRAIESFKREHHYTPIACELFLADEELHIGGTLDDVGIIDSTTRPRLVLIDLKTSNIGDKTSYFLQVALYYYMFHKLTGITIKEFYILHVSKENGTYKLIPIKNINLLIRDAKTLLRLHASIERITEEKKKEIKTI